MPVDRDMLMSELSTSFAPPPMPSHAGVAAGNIAAYTALNAAGADARRQLQSDLWNKWYQRTRKRMPHDKKDFRDSMKYGVLGAFLGGGADLAFEALKPAEVPGTGTTG
jgi:hypothetical protein